MEWKAFYITKLFSFIERGRRLKIEDRESGNIAFVTAGESNNGISSFIKNEKHKEYKNAITIDMFGNAFFQKGRFKCDDNITVLKNKNFKSEVYIFITSRLNILNQKYSYGKQLRPNRLIRDKIMLPIDSLGSPNWQFMEEYIKQKEKKHTKMIVEYYKEMLVNICRGEGSNSSLENVEWKEFFFSDIFEDIQRGKRLIKSNQLEGNIPYISSTAFNNGVDNFIGNKENVRKFNNNITLANSGSVGTAFYQPYEYIASDHVTALKLKKRNKYIYLFLASVIKKVEEKYSFNREINDIRIKREKILLPIDSLGNPNWQFMESYIKSIEVKQIEKIIKYLKSLER